MENTSSSSSRLPLANITNTGTKVNQNTSPLKHGETDKYLMFLHELGVAEGLGNALHSQLKIAIKQQLLILQTERLRLKNQSTDLSDFELKARTTTIESRIKLLHMKLALYKKIGTMKPGDNFAFPKDIPSPFLKSLEACAPPVEADQGDPDSDEEVERRRTSYAGTTWDTSNMTDDDDNNSKDQGAMKRQKTASDVKQHVNVESPSSTKSQKLAVSPQSARFAQHTAVLSSPGPVSQPLPTLVTVLVSPKFPAFGSTTMQNVFETQSTNIFSFLDSVDLLLARLVCHSWNGLLKRSLLLSKAITLSEKAHIYRILQERESQFSLGDFLSHQPQVNSKMRAILVDWIADVCHEFRHTEDTLHLSVRLVDRLLDIVPVPRRELQLVGCAAILLAAKIEEIYPPSLETLLYLCDNTYTRDQLLQMESVVLEKLGFRFTSPTTWTFMQWFFREFNFTPRAKNFAQYLLELSLQEYQLAKEDPSRVATAVACIALYNENLSYQALLTLSGWRPSQLAQISRIVLPLLERQQRLVAMVQKSTPSTRNNDDDEMPFLMSIVEKFSSEARGRVTEVQAKPGFETHLLNSSF